MKDSPPIDPRATITKVILSALSGEHMEMNNKNLGQKYTEMSYSKRPRKLESLIEQ